MEEFAAVMGLGAAMGTFDDVGISNDGLSLGLDDAVVLEMTGGIIRNVGLSMLGTDTASVRGVGGGAGGIL
jgi:hypothetical protein